MIMNVYVDSVYFLSTEPVLAYMHVWAVLVYVYMRTTEGKLIACVYYA